MRRRRVAGEEARHPAAAVVAKVAPGHGCRHRQIVASVLTDKDADDGSRVSPLLDQVDGPVASFTADGAFDRDDVHAEVAARHPGAAVVASPRASAIPSDTAEIMPTQRDVHLRCIAERSRMGWQKASGYNWRALVEADIARWKCVIGDGLRSQTDGRQATEVAIAADALNRMLSWRSTARPDFCMSRIADTDEASCLDAPVPPVNSLTYVTLWILYRRAIAAS
jgi:hypothetical protein